MGSASVPVVGPIARAIALASLSGLASVLASARPAFAEPIKDWQYDTQTQVLTLTLPESVTPIVSVIAPDQLLLELPDTQVGDVMGQQIEDGLVESIVLEQTTPETVWMVMEFESGIILSTDQSATLSAAMAAGEQQWQVRPALIAASRRAAGSAVASQSEAAALGPVESSASSLRQPSAIAQAPDFSELPILEPAVPLDQPVSVPPLPDRPTVVEPAQTETASESSREAVTPDTTAAEPALDSIVEETTAAIPVEVIPAIIPSVEPDALPSSPAAAVDGVVPEVPPFIGELDRPQLEASQSEEESIFVPESPVAVDSLPTEPMPEVPTVETEISLPTENVTPAAEETVPDEFIASGSPDERSIEPVDEDAFGRVTPANVSRWPEPIPFGQPLPE
ncbi:MAG: hypothetical protein AAFU53_11820 [Cyanobacteria bacterium J06632_3]